MNSKKLFWSAPLFVLAFIAKMEGAFAHCPLCVAGAAVAAGGAAKFGVSNAAIGIFLGAFAISMGLWFARLIKKQYIPYQNFSIVVFSFVSTIIPMISMFSTQYPIYISIIGTYGSILNRTYMIEMFLVTSVIGGLIVYASPLLSSKLTELRGKQIAYQGIIMNFVLLIFMAGIVQIIL